MLIPHLRHLGHRLIQYGHMSITGHKDILSIDTSNSLAFKVRRANVVCPVCGGDIADHMACIELVTPRNNIKYKKCRNCGHCWDIRQV